ncbi:MAG: hypothetical protein WBQ32_06075 [Ignavibacteriaceae bacterium]
MKTLRLFIFANVLLLIYACSTEPEYDYTYFKIMVDSLSHPDTISVNDTLKIKFYGFVGPDGCHEFSRFEEHKISYDLELTVWGSEPSFQTQCPEVLVYLNGEEYRTVLNQTGNYLIKINQPDNSFLLDSVYVL